MTARNLLRPGKSFLTHGPAAGVMTTHTKACVALWLGECALLFYRNMPIACMEHNRLSVAPKLPTVAIGYISRWLIDNNHPPMNRSHETDDFHLLVKRTMMFELGRML